MKIRIQGYDKNNNRKSAYLKDGFEPTRIEMRLKYLVVESYRTEKEKMNLLYWQVTCEAFCTPKEWKWWFKKANYKGDFSFIYFK